MTGHYDLFKTRNQESYKAIEKVFVPLQRSIIRYFSVDYGAVSLRIKFSNQAPGRSEPLVVTGRTGAGDFVLVKHLGDQSIAFAFDHWGRGGPRSLPVGILPDAVYDIEIQMGSLYPNSVSLFSAIFPGSNYNEVKNLLVVKLNGAEVLRYRSDFYPSTASEVKIGKNVIGGGICANHFSGDIIASSRIPPMK